MVHSHSIPAAQYLRMSTDQQIHSIENQKKAISDFAKQNGFEVVRTYEDPGESGVTLEHRLGLRQLLADVVSGNAGFKKIIVLDVSRWGRFQDADEAAHYEFVCKKAGVPIVYCAEDFDNEGSVPDYLAKVLKRTAAAEYSRELSIKSFDNHKRAVELGFRVGSEPGYAYRRMVLSREGELKGNLRKGEYKPLLTDRITLVHGPDTELKCIRSMFKMCLKHKSLLQVARELNRKGFRNVRRNWQDWMINDIVTNPKYAGTSGYGRIPTCDRIAFAYCPLRNGLRRRPAEKTQQSDRLHC